jgi:hypothetical protein
MDAARPAYEGPTRGLRGAYEDLPTRGLRGMCLASRCLPEDVQRPVVDKSARLLKVPETSLRGKARRLDCFVFEGVALHGCFRQEQIRLFVHCTHGRNDKVKEEAMPADAF